MEPHVQLFHSNHLSLGILSLFLTPPYGACCPIFSLHPPLPWYIKSKLNPLYMDLDIQFYRSSHLSLGTLTLIPTTSVWSLMPNFIILPTSPLAILSPCPVKGYRALTCGTLISCTTSFMTSFSTISSTSSSVSTSASSS